MCKLYRKHAAPRRVNYNVLCTVSSTISPFPQNILVSPPHHTQTNVIHKILIIPFFSAYKYAAFHAQPIDVRRTVHARNAHSRSTHKQELAYSQQALGQQLAYNRQDLEQQLFARKPHKYDRWQSVQRNEPSLFFS